ncbi:hypothetical protein Bca101_058498 [Brassica carinata]
MKLRKRVLSFLTPEADCRVLEDAIIRVPAGKRNLSSVSRMLKGSHVMGHGNYWGSWASWNFVPPEKKDQWWHVFIQHYYWDDQFLDEIYLKWKRQTQVTVCGRISQNRRDNRQPAYMSDSH